MALHLVGRTRVVLGLVANDHITHGASPLFGLHAGLTRQRGPFWNLGCNICGQLGRAVANHVGALFAQLVADFRQPERRDHGFV